MKVGTKSVLFGAHQFIIHPLFVAYAWWKLYGFPIDPRLWVAFFVHDLGYWGKPNMDGPEGETHPFLGAKIMGWFDRWGEKRTGQQEHPYYVSWYCFSFYHSRFMAKKYDVKYSRLCVADKLAISLEPWWFYIPRVWLSGELKEYLEIAAHKESKYSGEPWQKHTQSLKADGSVRGWFRAVCWYLDKWAYDHRNMKEDTWTHQQKKSS